MGTEIFLSIAIPILIASVAITAVVLAIKSFKEKGKGGFSMKTLWISYLYLMSLISLMLFLYGGIRFTRAMLANVTTPYFSYTTYEYVKPEITEVNKGEVMPREFDPATDPDQRIVEKDGKKFYYNYAEYKNDIYDGITFFVSLIIIFAIHRYLVIKADTDKESFLKKVYNFIALAQYGILSVIVLPMSIYQTIRFFVEDINLASYNRPIPGVMIALVIFVLPTWIIFLVRMAKENKQK